MNVLMLLPRLLPAPGITGSMLFTWAVLTSLRDRGHDVSVAAFDITRRRGYDPSVQRRALAELGVRLYEIEAHARWSSSLPGPQRLRQAMIYLAGLRQSAKGLIPQLRVLRGELADITSREHPDVIWAYGLPAVVATTQPSRPVPVLGSVVDLEWRARTLHIPSGRSPRAMLLQAMSRTRARLLHNQEASWLARANYVLVHAKQSLDWLETQGLDQCSYLPVPVPDAAGAQWREARDRLRPAMARFSIVGRLDGLHTEHGTRYFLEQVIPALDRRSTSRRFEVHVIGAGAVSPHLRRLCGHPTVVIRGFVPDIGAEFAASTALVVPVNIDLGFRVRVAEAFAWGTPVIAQRAACAGMPEIHDGENALLADSPEQLVEHMRAVLQDPALADRIGDAGRATFDRHYRADIVAAEIVSRLEKLAAHGSTRAERGA